MRPWGSLLLTAAIGATASTAGAQTLSSSPSSSPQSALFRAPFADDQPAAAPAPVTYKVSPIGLRADADVAAALEGPFVTPAYTGTALDGGLAGPPRVVGGGLASWSTGEVSLGGANAVRMTLGSVSRPHGGLVQARPDSLAEPEAEAFDVRYIHGWPSALKWSAAGYAMDVSPHAGFGVNNAGGTAEAGAMVRFGTDMGQEVAHRLGLHEVDPSAYGNRGRWYLFAAASGQAVGLNMTPGAPGLPRNSWSAETTSALISDAQAGVGWRKGDMQASFGYVHREIASQGPADIATRGINSAHISDSMVAFSLSIHP